MRTECGVQSWPVGAAAILQSSQIFSGLFLLSVFHLCENHVDYSVIYLISGVFTISSLIGIVMLMSVRSAETGLLQYTPKINTLVIPSRAQYDHLEMMSKVVEDDC